MINQVSINGTNIALTAVDYDVTISHGRSTVFDSPEPGNAQITIRGPVSLTLEPGQALTIANDGITRFTGEITDVRMNHLKEANQAVTTIIAIGPLSQLGYVMTGASGFSAETVRERAEEVLTDGGLPYFNGGTPDLDLDQISPGNEEIVPVLEYLGNLARWSGATYFDTPGNYIVFESYGVRGQTANPGIWAATPGTWAQQTQTWNAYPTNPDLTPVVLPADSVVWAPDWRKTLEPVINDVTVQHGTGQQHADRLEDLDSISEYGRRAIVLNTQLHNHNDALARGTMILLGQARPLWNMGQVTVLMDQLTPAMKTKVMGLLSGATVIVDGLPATAPETVWGGIVEGWTETYTPGLYTMTLSLSDRRYSYQTAAWEDVDPALTWGNVNATVEWFNVVEANDLI